MTLMSTSGLYLLMKRVKLVLKRYQSSRLAKSSLGAKQLETTMKSLQTIGSVVEQEGTLMQTTRQSRHNALGTQNRTGFRTRSLRAALVQAGVKTASERQPRRWLALHVPGVVGH